MLELPGALVKLGLLVSSLWLYHSTSDTEAEQVLTLDQETSYYYNSATTRILILSNRAVKEISLKFS